MSQKEPKLLVGVWFGPERRSKGKADESQLSWETATDGRGGEGRGGTLLQKVTWNKRVFWLGKEGIRKTPKRSHLGG